jgi:hypothetical protein
MSDRKLDHWRDRMVAALYGELTPEEERELEAAIDGDQTLREDWQELNETRQWLAAAGGDTVEPSWGFELPPGVVDARSESASRVVELRRWLLPAAAGFAAAATLFIGMLAAGLRVDRTPSGLLVRLEPTAAQETTVVTDPLAPGDRNTAVTGQEYITRAELAILMQGVIDVTAARLDDMERRQTGTQAQLTRALYDALADRQERHYDDLRTSIELAAFRTSQAVPYRPMVPGQRPHTPTTEEQDNDTY